MDFKDQIKQRLQTISREKICRFAWQCGLRALPFLSERRGFSYWKEADRKKHLYSVFYALDICAGGGMHIITDAVADAADAADAAAEAAADSAYAAAYAAA